MDDTRNESDNEARDQSRRASAAVRRLDADLNQEDDDGNGWTLVELSDFDPSWLFPGALVDVGRESFHGLATVLKTELFDTTTGRRVVLVTFRMDLRPGDVEKHREWFEAHGADYGRPGERGSLAHLAHLVHDIGTDQIVPERTPTTRHACP